MKLNKILLVVVILVFVAVLLYLANRSGFEEERHYCTDKDRLIEGCVKIYQPACGWNDPDKIQCVRYPCASNYDNGCIACQNEDVLYWTRGQCPK